jgi:hypothetical protein
MERYRYLQASEGDRLHHVTDLAQEDVSASFQRWWRSAPDGETRCSAFTRRAISVSTMVEVCPGWRATHISCWQDFFH